eukprot:TRINITY_DN4863_c0_g1_i1.p1 TRINITY_DN4863_c0_g1~~TRINITY_DN4863_c0_g1_i1.p1  ORF type:complete len:1243 (-),score=185.08 TRINITY_DN4863_c0_g1_i1:135-3320(-)
MANGSSTSMSQGRAAAVQSSIEENESSALSFHEERALSSSQAHIEDSSIVDAIKKWKDSQKLSRQGRRSSMSAASLGTVDPTPFDEKVASPTFSASKGDGDVHASPISLVSTGQDHKRQAVDRRQQIIEFARRHGAAEGPIEFFLKWDTLDDLDLLVKPPGHHPLISHAVRLSSGGILDIEQNSDEVVSNEPIEHVYWGSESAAPQGRYVVGIRRHEARSHSDTNWEVVIKMHNTTSYNSGTIEKNAKNRLFYLVGQRKFPPSDSDIVMDTSALAAMMDLASEVTSSKRVRKPSGVSSINVGVRTTPVGSGRSLLQQATLGKRRTCHLTGCLGWSPSIGLEEGRGAFCDFWGSSTKWCFVHKDYVGPGFEFKKASTLYAGKYWAPCSADEHATSTEQLAQSVLVEKASTTCLGWSPPDLEGYGSSCDTWGSKNKWCFVSTNYNGRWSEFIDISSKYPGKAYAPCDDTYGSYAILLGETDKTMEEHPGLVSVEARAVSEQPAQVVGPTPPPEAAFGRMAVPQADESAEQAAATAPAGQMPPPGQISAAPVAALENASLARAEPQQMAVAAAQAGLVSATPAAGRGSATPAVPAGSRSATATSQDGQISAAPSVPQSNGFSPFASEAPAALLAAPESPAPLAFESVVLTIAPPPVAQVSVVPAVGHASAALAALSGGVVSAVPLAPALGQASIVTHVSAEPPVAQVSAVPAIEPQVSVTTSLGQNSMDPSLEAAASPIMQASSALPAAPSIGQASAVLQASAVTEQQASALSTIGPESLAPTVSAASPVGQVSSAPSVLQASEMPVVEQLSVAPTVLSAPSMSQPSVAMSMQQMSAALAKGQKSEAPAKSGAPPDAQAFVAPPAKPAFAAQAILALPPATGMLGRDRRVELPQTPSPQVAVGFREEGGGASSSEAGRPFAPSLLEEIPRTLPTQFVHKDLWAAPVHPGLSLDPVFPQMPASRNMELKSASPAPPEAVVQPQMASLANPGWQLMMQANGDSSSTGAVPERAVQPEQELPISPLMGQSTSPRPVPQESSMGTVVIVDPQTGLISTKADIDAVRRG